MAFSTDSWRNTRLADLDTGEVLQLFEAETAHDSGRTAQTFRTRIAAALGRYGGMHGDPPHLLDLIGDHDDLARLLMADRSRRNGRQVGRDELKRLRQALTAFVAWLPLPPRVSRDELRGVLAAARDTASETRGLRKITRGGRPPETDERHVPTAGEIERVLAALRVGDDPLSHLTADLVAVCYLTGSRVGAMLDLRREDVVRGSDGRPWLVIWEKARPDRRPLLARADRRNVLDEWESLPSGARLWRAGDRVLTKDIARRRLRSACVAAGVDGFPFHRLRHAFATDISRYMGLRKVRYAGGWLADPMAEHYMGTPHGGPP